MLSFKFISSSSGAESYYENKDDYYTKDDHRGQWEGNGAKALGLEGGVDREVFKNLLDGRLPNGEQIRKKMTNKQGDGKTTKPRLGIDFTFSAPKSVSIAALVNSDTKIIKAHDEAVRAAIKMLEGKAIARKKVKGVSYRQNTNTLIAAAFRHDLSRAQDPQLHTHAVVMNLTQRDDKQWVALTNDELLKSVKVVGAYYRAELAQRLEKLGYEIRATRDGFEMANVSDKAIDIFSKRSKQIESVLESRGLNRDKAGSDLKQRVTTGTRPNKTDADREELRKEWVAVLSEAGIKLKKGGVYEEVADKVKEVATEIGRSIIPKQVLDHFERKANERVEEVARRSVDFGIEHLAERQGIFTKGELLERAMIRSLGSIEAIEKEVEAAKKDGRLVTELPLFQSAKSFSKEQKASMEFQNDKFKSDNDTDKLTRSSWVALTMANSKMSQSDAEKLVDDSIKNGRLVKTEERFTTNTMLTAEKKILSLEEQSRNTVLPVKTMTEVESLFAESTLNSGQKDAVNLILTSENRFVGIQGYAGTGKSHMLSEAVNVIKEETAKAAQSQGYTVIGLAPYASQNKALAELGMESQTLASFLLRKTDQERLNPRAIVFLDEASVVPAHQMLSLMEKIDASGARLVTIGDKKQTQAVESGKPFEQLQNNGMSVAHLFEIQRQKTPELKAAVISAAGGHIDAAVRQLNSRTEEIKKEDDRHAAIAKEYVSLPETERQQTLIVAGTNDARQSINKLVRSELNLKDDHQIQTYDSVDMTRAEKKQAGSYSPGRVILLEGEATQGLAKRTYYEIESVSDKLNQLSVLDPAGNRITVMPDKMRDVSVFDKQVIPLAKGDWVRITRNNTNQGVHNGERHQITSISRAKITLSNGAVLPRTERLHLQHGYATTVHSSQGMTTNRVIIDANTKSLTSNRAVFYVAISRPRNELKIYTDNRAKLVEVMTREPKKYAALELRSGDAEKKVLNNAVIRQNLRKSMQPKEATKAKIARQR